MEAAGFEPEGSIVLDEFSFDYDGHVGFLAGRHEGAGKWGFVRYIQGDAWGGPQCGGGDIPWYVPGPLSTDEYELRVDLDYLISKASRTNLLDSWIMFAVNVWFQDPDADTNKRLVMDLAVFHEKGLWPLDGLRMYEDDYAFHYQVPVHAYELDSWESLHLDLNDHILQALLTEYEAECEETECVGRIPYYSLALTQLEFVTELHNSEGEAYIDNFFLRYRPR